MSLLLAPGYETHAALRARLDRHEAAHVMLALQGRCPPDAAAQLGMTGIALVFYRRLAGIDDLDLALFEHAAVGRALDEIKVRHLGDEGGYKAAPSHAGFCAVSAIWLFRALRDVAIGEGHDARLCWTTTGDDHCFVIVPGGGDRVVDVTASQFGEPAVVVAKVGLAPRPWYWQPQKSFKTEQGFLQHLRETGNWDMDVLRKHAGEA